MCPFVGQMMMVLVFAAAIQTEGPQTSPSVAFLARSLLGDGGGGTCTCLDCRDPVLRAFKRRVIVLVWIVCGPLFALRP
uniref:Putative secreted protein n=1 Tax=Anopheles marajoara TaxID=58244 RepID=A0A2M4CC26_9DIPT